MAVELAPIAQRSFGGFRFKVIPAIESTSSCQQGAEFRVGTFFAEYVSNLIVIVWQKFADKIQHRRLAEVELPLVWDRYVFFIILDVIR
jgi:hypothetical protein